MNESVYFIEADNGLVKIGKSRNVRKRLYAIRGHSPIGLRLIHVINCNGKANALERYFHKKFESRHHHGEWYRLTEREKKNITKINGEDISYPDYLSPYPSVKGRDGTFRKSDET